MLVRSDRRDPELARQFGLRLRRVRLESGLTQEDLAQRAGVDRTFPGRVERGETSPTLVTLVRLADALEVDPAVLVERLTLKQNDDVRP